MELKTEVEVEVAEEVDVAMEESEDGDGGMSWKAGAFFCLETCSRTSQNFLYRVLNMSRYSLLQMVTKFS